MPPTLTFWFEFASTYSYPAAMRIAAQARKADVALRWQPFLLGPIFKSQDWADSPFNLFPAKGSYMWRDLERICATLDLPFRRPEPFPQPSLLAARIAVFGLDAGWGEDFVRAVYRAQFADGRQIGDDAVLADILHDLEVNPWETIAHAQSEPIKAKLRANVQEAQRLKIFGAPSFTTADGELFWGNDRLEAALDWANGRAARPAAQRG